MKFEIDGILTALSPLFHGGDEKTGSSPVLRTINLYVEEIDGVMPFPYVSGNSIRGKCRRLLVRDFFERIGYEAASAKIHHVFFTGGILESTQETTAVIDLEFRREIYKLLTPIAVFGTTIGNQALEGNLIVEHLWPICREYAPYLPERLREDPRAKKSIREFTGQSFLTRRDDLKAERADDEQAHQMKIDYECFVPGTQFYHRWGLKLQNDLHASCLAAVLELLADNPFLGGRSAAGDGKVQLGYGTPDNFSPGTYREFVEAHKPGMLDLIHQIEQRMEHKPKKDAKK